MSYEQQLIAAGIPPEQAARDAWADCLTFWRNREHPAYGRMYEAEQIADAAPEFPED